MKATDDGQKLWPMKIGSIRFFFLLVDRQRWSLCNFHCANVDAKAEKHNGPWIFHIQAVSFPSWEKGVRDPRNVHVLRGISLIQSFSSLNVKRFTRVSRNYFTLYTVLITVDLRKYDYRRWLDEELARTRIVSNVR